MPCHGGDVVPCASRQQVQALQEEVSSSSLKRRLAEVVADVPECPLCLEIMTNPVELQDCRHLYCCQCFYKHVNSNAVGSRACPMCRCRISKAPLAVPTCFNELLERLKKEKEQQEQVAAGCGGGGEEAGAARKQEGRKRKKGGGPVIGMPSSGAGDILGEEPVGAEDEEGRYLDAAATVSAAQVARHTYNLQMDDMRVMFEIERQRRDRVQQRRGARAGGGEGGEKEKVEEGVILYYAPEDIFWCPLCGFEVEDDQAHTCGEGEEEEGEEEEADQEEVGAGVEEDEHEPQSQQNQQQQEQQGQEVLSFTASFIARTLDFGAGQVARVGTERAHLNVYDLMPAYQEQQQLTPAVAPLRPFRSPLSSPRV